MTRLIAVSTLAVLVGAGAVLAQTAGAQKGAVKMTQAECQSLWSKADATKAGSLTEAQARSYVSDFKAVDANHDGKLTSTEFTAACDKGLVHGSAATGSGTGASGKSK